LREDGTIDAWNSVLEGGAPSFTGIKAIAAGYQLGVALKNDGTVSAWGNNNDFGQANVPGGLSNVVAISSNLSHSLALKSDGTVVAWGRNDYGQSLVPPDLRDVISIKASYRGGLAKQSDGTFLRWGGFNPPWTIAPGWNMFADSFTHWVALLNDGTVQAGSYWDTDSEGASVVPPGLAGVMSVDCGDQTSYALKVDGTVLAWGWNNSGQTTIHPDIRGVTAIAAGLSHAILLKKAP
jgi:alpha-tubulin suppressor-like RCC1 family protein